MRVSTLNLALVIGGILILAACSPTEPADAPEIIYHNGTIITMAGDAPETVEAVAVREGVIVEVGEAERILGTVSASTRVVDLEGKTLLPGFVDSHSHMYMIGLQAATANLLPPPDGEGASVASLQDLLRTWAEENPRAIERVGWIGGFGYDDSQLAEKRHPTKEELDAVSTEFPVIIIHQSGHIGVANSKALELAGVTADTPDPEGGVFRRVTGTREPNGVCEEYAFFYMLGNVAAKFDDDISEKLAEAGGKLVASFGYTTAQEGRAMALSRDAIKRVADKGLLGVDVVVYPDILEVDDIEPTREYTNGFRVGGAKLTIDGSPQGKTAWLTQPYHVPPEGRPDDYRGYAAIDDDTTRAAVEKAFAKGWQILCHANGDAASDAFIAAVEAAKAKYPNVDNRPVLIHGQVLREDQVDKLDELGIFPSLFPMHTYYWGDWHRDSVLGPERAQNISPTGWVSERGMRFGSHHDAPVALPDSMRVLSATVTRRTRSGEILGPQHRVSVYDGLRALTIWPAWQHFEEDSKGSIEVGKLADFVILSANPLEVPEDQLDDLKVLETIKEGETIYRRPAQEARVAPASFGIMPTSNSHVHEHEGAHGDGCLNPALDVLARALAASAAGAAEPESEPALEGTAWQLVKIMSMDDSVYTPDDKSKYTLSFGEDGALTVRADCNRGRGTWTREGESGLQFGDIAITSALCPPGSLHDRFVSDLNYVRSLVAREGHIYLATMADGAILEFEPLVAEQAVPSFDCTRAEGSVEELICDDSELAALDVELQEVYERALGSFPEEDLPTLKASQRGWIKGRNACWKAEDLRACVLDNYERRITELQIRGGALVVPAAVAYSCGEGRGLSAVFYNEAKRPAAVLTRESGEQVIAFKVPAASGTRYEGRNVEFWSKAEEASVTWLGETLTCKTQ